MKIAIICDLHIEEKWFGECSDIMSEILDYQSDAYYSGGDLWEKHKPTYAELIFASQFLGEKKISKVVIGNHEKVDQLTPLDIWKPHHVEICEHIIVEDKDYSAYIGHQFTDKTYNYDKVKLNLESLNQYKHIVLGHYHHFQIIQGTAKHIRAVHPGAVRFVNFDERVMKNKVFAVLDTDKKTLDFIPLKSPIPMQDFSTLEELKSIPKKTKVRYVTQDWEDYKKNLGEISKYAQEYADFKIVMPKATEKIEGKQREKGKKVSVFFTEEVDKIKEDRIKNLASTTLKKHRLI